jgi:hypothetical protein
MILTVLEQNRIFENSFYPTISDLWESGKEKLILQIPITRIEPITISIGHDLSKPHEILSRLDLHFST